MSIAAVHESVLGTKRTSAIAPHMAALEGKADIGGRGDISKNG